MSVVGVDLGSYKSVISVARNRGIDVIANEVSNRYTPSQVSFNGNQRFLGEGAKTQEVMNYKNTVSAMKQILGRQFDEAEVQNIEKKFALFNMVAGSNGQTGAQVRYKDENCVFDATQLQAMYLSQVKKTTEAAINTTASDIVLGVPAFYTEQQRRCLLAASEIAGLNCLRLMSEPAAAALQYGITRALDLPEKEPRHVCFVDVGHSAMTVSVVAFTQEKAQIKGVAFDRFLGGRDFDEALVQHFAQEIKTKHKVDVFEMPKALVRLRVGIEKCKKVLSANLKAPLNIECLTDTVDLNSAMDRESFEKMVAGVLGRIKPVLETAISRSGVKLDQIEFVELIGGSTRIPSVKQQIVEFFGGKESLLSTTLNLDEAVARGACFQCAQLSPLFKVRDYVVKDVTPYTIKLDGSTLFEASEEIPKTKKVPLKRSEAFQLVASYADDALPVGHSTKVGTYMVGNVAPTADGAPQDVNVEIRINADGLLSVKNAYTTETVIVEEPVPEPMETDDKKADDKKADDKKADDKKDDKAEGDKPKEEDKDKDTPMTDAEKPAEAEPEKPKEPKKKVIKHALPVTIQESLALPVAVVNVYREQEAQMVVNDKLIRETLERKNQLEAYVYEIRGKLETTHSDYMEEVQKEEFMRTLTTTEDWLYDEGEDAQKSVFVERLESLQKIGNPVQERFLENELRPKAIKDFQITIAEFRDRGSSMDEKYAHIEAEDKGKVIDQCDKASAWLEKQLAKQKALKKHEPLVITVAQIQAERTSLFNVCNPIMTKPKPKVEPPKEEEKPAATETPKTEEAPKKDEDTPMSNLDVD